MKTPVLAVAALLSAAALAQQPKSSSSAQPTKAFNAKVRIVNTYDAFNGRLQNLKNRLAAEPDPRKRYALFSQTADELNRLKATSPRPEDEKQALEMSLILETFADMPSKAKFNPANCQQDYKHARLKMMNRVDGEKEDPGVTKGLQILNAVCGEPLTS